MFNKVIYKNRETIGNKINIDMKQVLSAMDLLYKCLKPRFANQFYFYDKEQTVFISIDDKLSISKLRSNYSHFFGSDYVAIYGVTVKRENDTYIFEQQNIVDEIPIAFKSEGDQDLYELREAINKINENIKNELQKILNKDNEYIEYVNKGIVSVSTEKHFLNTVNEKLNKSDIVKKVSKKINQYYHKDPIGIEAHKISVGFNKIELGIYSKVEPYIYDTRASLTFKRDYIWLGTLELNLNGKHRFTPSFKNSKYLTSEISSIRYMRNSFKKHIIEKGIK